MQEKNNISKEDFETLEFLLKYKMLKIEDASLIYKTKRYYRQRINKLIDKGYVKRYKNYIVLDKKGRKELNKIGFDYIKNIKNEAYMERLRNIASIATLSINSNIKFIPSWDIKEKDKYTETARRYIGKLIIEDREYLTYYISDKKEHIYIKQLLFDANKALLREMNSINIHDLLESLYEKEVLISDWDKADYLLEDGRYIIYMPFINTEKITSINWYYLENSESNRKLEIVTLEENEKAIQGIVNNKCQIKSFNKNWLGGINEE